MNPIRLSSEKRKRKSCGAHLQFFPGLQGHNQALTETHCLFASLVACRIACSRILANGKDVFLVFAVLYNYYFSLLGVTSLLGSWYLALASCRGLEVG